MSHANSQPPHPDPELVPFRAVFEQSRIPMALIGRDRRYVDVNDAVVELYEYPRAEILGSRAGRTVVGDRSDDQWEQLISTNELYGEHVVTHANGARMRVSYAANAATRGRRWLALFVTLSARFHPGGPELIGTPPVGSRNGRSATLTRRERQVVRLVALGSSTRRIAAELCLSPETVRSHVRNAMAKTNAHTRAQLVAMVLADGLIDG